MNEQEHALLLMQRTALFQTWSDVPPEMICIFEGSEEAARAWVAGFNYATKHPHEQGNGYAMTFSEILYDPSKNGVPAVIKIDGDE